MALIKLIKNSEVYAPEYLGKKDVLIANDKICQIDDKIELNGNINVEIIEGENKLMVPGFIDSHVHILGGGGEGGYKTRTPEIMLSDVVKGGVTTVIGCLGTDGYTRSMENLIAKAKGLEEEGITCYTYTGSYRVPTRTLLKTIQEDMLMVDRIIGVGEVAMSDHRSSQPTMDEIARIAADARVGGMLSGKAGIVNVHIGTGERMLKKIEKIIEETEIPITQFLPTHLGRNPKLLSSAANFAKKGGYIDFTTSTSDMGSVNRKDVRSCLALKKLLDEKIPIENISFSSDAQGSLPIFDEKGTYLGLKVGSIYSLFKEVKLAVKEEKIPLETAVKVITSNPAKCLKLENKGKVAVGKDADLVLLNSALEIETVLAKGQVMMKEKQVLVKGTFE